MEEGGLGMGTVRLRWRWGCIGRDQSSGGRVERRRLGYAAGHGEADAQLLLCGHVAWKPSEQVGQGVNVELTAKGWLAVLMGSGERGGFVVCFCQETEAYFS